MHLFNTHAARVLSQQRIHVFSPFNAVTLTLTVSAIRTVAEVKLHEMQMLTYGL